MTAAGPEAMSVAALRSLYETLADRRNSAWTAQSILEAAAGLPEEMPEPSAAEAWWHAQGRAEVLAEVMTILELGVPGLPPLGGPGLEVVCQELSS